MAMFIDFQSAYRHAVSSYRVEACGVCPCYSHVLAVIPSSPNSIKKCSVLAALSWDPLCSRLVRKCLCEALDCGLACLKSLAR